MIFVCSRCERRFKAWDGKSGVQTHANDEHGGARIRIELEKAGKR